MKRIWSFLSFMLFMVVMVVYIVSHMILEAMDTPPETLEEKKL